MTMDDRKLAEELERLGSRWRVAPEPPLEAMWRQVEAEAFAPREGPRQGGGDGRWRQWLPLAAMLALGVAVGQLAPRIGGGPPVPPTGVDSAGLSGLPARASSEPFVGIASGYLEQVAGLLVTLARETEQGQPLEHSTRQARELLATTRLMLDSPGEIDPALATLLDDLELVLVQVARLPNRPSAPDVYLIDQALDQREVLPRLRVMLANAQDSRPH